MLLKDITKIMILVLVMMVVNCHKMSTQEAVDLLDPVKLRPHMFKIDITGQMDIMVPFKQYMNLKGEIFMEKYEIDMVKIKKQILPQGLFG